MFHVRENRMLPPVKMRLELVTLYSGRVQLFMFDIEGSGMVTTDAREARRVVYTVPFTCTIEYSGCAV